MADRPPARSKHPVTYEVEPQIAGRNRIAVAFRPILSMPHWLLVGEPGSEWGGGGTIGLAAAVTAVISWFAIILTGRQPRGLWDFTDSFMRWRGNAVAYMALLRDEYPPFGPGDGGYPARFDVAAFPDTRDRWSVGLRIIYVTPQLVVLVLLSVTWMVTVIIGWFAILLTGRYPEGLYKFGVGVVRWSLRIQAYMLLMHDQYPPFNFD